MVERHGRHRVEFRQEVGGGARDPAREETGQIGAVGMLQLEDQVARILVIKAGGAEMVEGGPSRLAVGAKSADPQVEFERRAAEIAEWGFDEGDARPGAGGETARLGGAGSPGSFIERARRQGQIEQAPARPAQAGQRWPDDFKCRQSAPRPFSRTHSFARLVGLG